MAKCDPSTLLAQASCFQCLPDGQKMLARLALLCNIARSGGAAIDLLAGLAGWWKMEESTGATRLDSSGQANSLADNLSNISQAVGKIGFSVEFTNLFNQALIGTSTPTVRLGPNDPYTLTAWVFPTNSPVGGGIIRLLRPGGQIVFDLGLVTNLVQFAFGGGSFGGGGNQLQSTFGPLPVNTWTFVVAEANPPAGTAFIRINDSVQDNFSGAPFTNVNGGIDEFVESGFNIQSAPNSILARIDELRYYKQRLLTAAEQTALFNL